MQTAITKTITTCDVCNKECGHPSKVMLQNGQVHEYDVCVEHFNFIKRHFRNDVSATKTATDSPPNDVKSAPHKNHVNDSKYCKRCDAVKPMSEFYRDKYKSSGYRSWCIPCTRDADNTRHQTDRKIHRVRIPRPTHKRCYTCRMEKPYDDFRYASQTGNGANVVRARCKACTEVIRDECRKKSQGVATKQCKQCLKLLPKSQFVLYQHGFDGLHLLCKSCMNRAVDAAHDARRKG